MNDFHKIAVFFSKKQHLQQKFVDWSSCNFETFCEQAVDHHDSKFFWHDKLLRYLKLQKTIRDSGTENFQVSYRESARQQRMS